MGYILSCCFILQVPRCEVDYILRDIMDPRIWKHSRAMHPQAEGGEHRTGAPAAQLDRKHALYNSPNLKPTPNPQKDVLELHWSIQVRPNRVPPSTSKAQAHPHLGAVSRSVVCCSSSRHLAWAGLKKKRARSEFLPGRCSPELMTRQSLSR